MNYYQNLILSLQEQDVVIQRCARYQKIAHDRVIVYKVEENNQVEFRHQLIAGEQKIYLFVEQGATVSLQSFEQVSDLGQQSEIDVTIVLEQDAQFFMNFAIVHTLKLVGKIFIYLQGDRSRVDVQGLYALDGQQQVQINTYQYHIGHSSQSNLVIKGMLNGNAFAQYQGLIKIEESAHGTNASQENKNIVLSSGAKVISVPTIEVLQHNVQCCHGSAVGKFDQSALWYLQIKGFLPKQAHTFLIRSFFQEVLEGSENQNEIMDVVCQKMI